MGPGILLAGAAIGGSHIVQSTKAGAIYGFTLIWAIILANLFKYPFFEYCQRYTAATGESIIQGYSRLGRWALIIFLIISFVSGYLNISALTVITAGLAAQLFGIGLTPLGWSIIVCAVCVGLLVAGRYPALDLVMKIIIVILAVSTIGALIAAMARGSQGAPGAVAPSVFGSFAGLSFLLALMGWMPAPVDVAVFPSLWALERLKQTHYRPTLRETLIDFNIGYIGTAVLALAFLSLGALVMFGTGEQPESAGAAFSRQLVNLYTRTLGPWSAVFIAVAAFTTIFSTTLTCFDAYTRSVHASVQLALGRTKVTREDTLHWVLMGSFVLVTLIIVQFFMTTMAQLLNTATIVAFLTAPILAVINFVLITGPLTPAEYRPPLWLRLLSIAGIIFLVGFTLLYVKELL